MKRLVAVILLLLAVSVAHGQYDKAWFFWMGRRHLVEQEYREAIRIYNALLRVDPEDSEAYFFRGIAKANLDDNLGAEADFSAAVQHNPLNTMAWHHRAVSRMLLGNYDEALEDFAMAIEIRPDLPGPYYSRGYTYLMNRQFPAAIEDLTTYIFHNNRVADAYLLRGSAHLQNRDTLSASADFDRAIFTNRDDPEGYLRRGGLAMARGDYAAALTDFDTAVARDSSYLNSYFNRALARERLGRFPGALSDLDRVIAMDPDNPVAYYNRAIVNNQMGNYSAAVEDYDRVSVLSPDNVVAYYNRAIIKQRLGDLAGAESDFSRAISLYPDFAAAYSARSDVRFLLRDTRGARQDRQMNERKIAEYRARLSEGEQRAEKRAEAIDPTEEVQDRLMSFETRFTGTNFDRLASERENLALLPLFRFTLRTPDTVRRVGPVPYYFADMERFRQDVGMENLAFSNKEPDIAIDGADAPEDHGWQELFRRSITQSLVRQYTNSINSISQAIASNPTSPYLYINRSTTRAEMIDFISSVGASSSQRLTIESDPELRMRTGARQTYNYDEAIADLDRAIELEPGFAYTYYNRANLLVMSDRLPEAFDDYTRAIELNPHFAEAYYNRGLVQIYLRDTRKGYLDISKAGEEGIEAAYELIERYNPNSND